MSSKLMITEPHPTVMAGTFTHAGRGGAGNTFRAGETTSPAGVPSHTVKSQRSSRAFYSGIGGAGNRHKASERASINFDEEFTRAKVRDSHSVGHVGVGGAGNIYRKHSAGSDTSSRRDSTESGASSAGFWGRLSSSSFTRH